MLITRELMDKGISPFYRLGLLCTRLGSKTEVNHDDGEGNSTISCRFNDHIRFIGLTVFARFF